MALMDVGMKTEVVAFHSIPARPKIIGLDF